MVLMRGDSISPFELEFIGTLSLDVLLRICERKDSSLIGSAISIDNDFMAVVRYQIILARCLRIDEPRMVRGDRRRN